MLDPHAPDPSLPAMITLEPPEAIDAAVESQVALCFAAFGGVHLDAEAGRARLHIPRDAWLDGVRAAGVLETWGRLRAAYDSLAKALEGDEHRLRMRLIRLADEHIEDERSL